MRKSAEELGDLSGPSGDYNNSTKSHFMIASNALAGSDSPKNAITKLESPYFEGKQHPNECLHFWFYIEVRLFKGSWMEWE